MLLARFQRGGCCRYLHARYRLLIDYAVALRLMPLLMLMPPADARYAMPPPCLR